MAALFDIHVYLQALVVLSLIGVIGWIVSVVIRNVSIVDSLWAMFFLVAASVYVYGLPETNARSLLVFVLVFVWALRLTIYISVRNWGEAEDYRYQQIRANNEPFWIRSLYIVFGLQALLAWIISLPLYVAVSEQPTGLGVLDYIAIALWILGFTFEAVGDYQLAKFKAVCGATRAIQTISVISVFGGLFIYLRLLPVGGGRSFHRC